MSCPHCGDTRTEVLKPKQNAGVLTYSRPVIFVNQIASPTPFYSRPGIINCASRLTAT